MKALISVKSTTDPSLREATDAMKRYDIHYEVATPPEVYGYLTKQDFVIALGGDGTVLGTSRLMKMGGNADTPLLTMRSNTMSVGALCYYQIPNINSVLEKITLGKYDIENWTQAMATCKGRSISGLNEIYVGSEFSVRASKYNLKFRGKEEYHISSGVIVATGTGATGWFQSVLGKYPSRFPHDHDSPELSYIVRELSLNHTIDPDGDPLDECEVIEEDECLTIKWKHDRHGIVASDGSFKSAFPITAGDEVVIKNAHDPVKVIRCHR